MQPPATGRRWKPSAGIQASVALHAGAAAAAVVQPSLWPWLLAGVVADHLVLTAAGLWPRSSLLGPNLTRLPPGAATGRLALTIDDGPDPDITPRVLEVLEKYRTCATFFCIGERVARHAEVAREIVARGHAIENHSQRHRHSFSLLGPRGLTAEIAAAQDQISGVTGQRPRFFRAPAGLRNPFLEPVLARQDLHLASWTRRGFDTVRNDTNQIFRTLTRGLGEGDILLLHDGHAARTPTGVPVILEVLPRLLDAVAAAGFVPVTLRSTLP
ncbi:MAG TPA: polysaccharide deacetylase family protein [Steroidobacteraceae bacterium]|nr:polysaccharide deacetylase family protein [Steroidobacteraceae bacterium]